MGRRDVRLEGLEMSLEHDRWLRAGVNGRAEDGDEGAWVTESVERRLWLRS